MTVTGRDTGCGGTPTWELRANLTSYDGVYVALGCALVTADAWLGRTPGLPCDVELVV